MKSNSACGSVTISIKKSDSKDSTSICLSRWQFESIVIGVPACAVAGVVAVGILIFNVPMRPKNGSYISAAQYAESINGVSSHLGAAKEPLAASQGVVTPDSLSKTSRLKAKGALVGETPSKTSLEVARPSEGVSRSSSLTADVDSKITSPKGAQEQGAKNQDERGTRKGTGEVAWGIASEHSDTDLPASSQDELFSAVSSANDSNGANSVVGNQSLGGVDSFLSVTKNIKVDEIYDISAKVYQSESGSPVLAKISMTNLTGMKEKGRLWVKVLVGSGDEEQWLSSQMNLPADDSMNVKGPKIGKFYVFQRWVEHELSLGVPRIQAKEIKEIILGAETEKHGQKVAKIDLRTHTDRSSGM